MPDRYRQRDGVLPQRRHPPLRVEEARRLSLLARLGLRKAADDKADPARIAAVGSAVRAKLASHPDAGARGNKAIDLFAVPGFAGAAECRKLVAAIEREARPTPLFMDGGSGRTDLRTSSTHFFTTDATARALAGRIDALLGLDGALGEPLQGQRYRKGEHYLVHTDVLRPERDHWQRERLRGGQRTWTAMVYLNDVAGGGETDFPEAGVTIAPQRGLLVAWDNHDRSGRPDRATRHAGLPVTAGKKFIVTRWYRLEPWGGAGGAS